MCDEQIKDLVRVFLSTTTDVNEEKVKCLFVVPLLQYCYLKLDKTLDDVFSNFIFDKEGEGKGDIRIKISSSTILLVETKKEEKDWLEEVESTIIWPGSYKLHSSYSNFLFMDNEGKLYNLNRDYFGQILRYALQQLSEYSEVRLILTNGIKWYFFCFNREDLDSLKKEMLREGSQVVAKKKEEEKTLYGCSIKDFKDKVDERIELSLDRCDKLLEKLQDYMKA